MLVNQDVTYGHQHITHPGDAHMLRSGRSDLQAMVSTQFLCRVKAGALNNLIFNSSAPSWHGSGHWLLTLQSPIHPGFAAEAGTLTPTTAPNYHAGSMLALTWFPVVAGALNRHSFNSSAPSWRQSGHGLNIEGRCRTRTCAAYKHRVIAVKVSALLTFGMLSLQMLLLLLPA